LHALCHAVTLTFDLLALNFHSTLDVMRLNYVQNLSEIHNSPLSYWRFSTFSSCSSKGGAFLPNGS